jgi:hypothetical protein
MYERKGEAHVELSMQAQLLLPPCFQLPKPLQQGIAAAARWYWWITLGPAADQLQSTTNRRQSARTRSGSACRPIATDVTCMV